MAKVDDQNLDEFVGTYTLPLGQIFNVKVENEQKMIVKLFGMVSKLAPVVAKIDFYKSSASYVEFDGKTYHSRSVTHYVSPSARDKPDAL